MIAPIFQEPRWPVCAQPADEIIKLQAGLFQLRAAAEENLLPVFAAVNFNGHARPFAKLPLKCRVYALEDDHLHTGSMASYEQMLDLTAYATNYAMMIINECSKNDDPGFHLIGGSMGTIVAHRIATIAATIEGGDPRLLVLIDPLPPPPFPRLRYPRSLSFWAAELEWYFTPEPLPREELMSVYADIPDSELGILYAHRLTQAGVQPFSQEKCTNAVRTLRVVASRVDQLKCFESEPVEGYNGRLLIATASDRHLFFDMDYGATKEQCAPEKLVYWGREGAIIRWVHEEGDHLTVVSECEQNARPAFTQALQELLEVDISDSSSWESNLTPPSESNLTTRPPSTRDSRES